MMFGDNEKDLINDLQLITTIESTLILPKPSKMTKHIFELIADAEQWKDWNDSSGKGAPPPDFYSDKHHIMMDVMRVDDHERKGKKGKLYNPLRQHERELYRELIQNGIIDQYPNANVIINGITELPTHEDHNYTFYKNNFRRVLQKHIDSIPLYRENHPGYKIVFFVYDESSAYFEAEHPIDRQEQRRKGDGEFGRPHFFFLDDAFLETFISSEIDYLIWFTPYKLIEYCIPQIQLPKICVFDLSNKDFRRMKYCEDKMTSVEI